MANNIIDEAQSALRDVVGMVPVAYRETVMADIQTLERALYLLAQAIDFQRAVAAKAERFDSDIKNAAASREPEANFPFSGSF